MSNGVMTLQEAVGLFLEHVKNTRSIQTARTYGYALRGLLGFASPSLPLEAFSLDLVAGYLDSLSGLSPYTERVHIQAIKSFLVFLAAQRLMDVDFPRLSLILKGRRRLPPRLIAFPEQGVERLLEVALEMVQSPPGGEDLARLRALRDAALIVTLAHTGLRVSEVVRLKVGDVQWLERRAVIMGKGQKKAVVRFSSDAIEALKAYLEARSRVISPPSPSQPLFSGHGGQAERKLKPLSARQVERILSDWVTKVLGEEHKGTITPHTLRHYFVTRVVREAGVSVARRLARHSSITTTDAYTHLADEEVERAYRRAFED